MLRWFRRTPKEGPTLYVKDQNDVIVCVSNDGGKTWKPKVEGHSQLLGGTAEFRFPRPVRIVDDEYMEIIFVADALTKLAESDGALTPEKAAAIPILTSHQYRLEAA